MSGKQPKTNNNILMKNDPKNTGLNKYYYFNL